MRKVNQEILEILIYFDFEFVRKIFDEKSFLSRTSLITITFQNIRCCDLVEERFTTVSRGETCQKLFFKVDIL